MVNNVGDCGPAVDRFELFNSSGPDPIYLAFNSMQIDRGNAAIFRKQVWNIAASDEPADHFDDRSGANSCRQPLHQPKKLHCVQSAGKARFRQMCFTKVCAHPLDA